MHRSFFATKDAFINSGSDTITGEDFKNKNTGQDEILELKKVFYNRAFDYPTRVLVQFDADEVENALLALPESKAKPPENPMSADRVKWEHINRVFELCNRNVSETARRLKMHRRTLQRILSKRSPK